MFFRLIKISQKMSLYLVECIHCHRFLIKHIQENHRQNNFQQFLEISFTVLVKRSSSVTQNYYFFL